MKTAVIIVIICFIGMLYTAYQFARNNKVYSIRQKWIADDDRRWYKYDYDDMYIPGKHNWYGLLWPNDKHFK